MRRALPGAVLLATLLAGAILLAACDSDAPVVVSREALGTVVSITAYGDDDAAIASAIDDAYVAMAEVEAQLDVYDPGSALSRFNAQPYTEQELPEAAVAVLDAVETLGVADSFSPALLAVTRLYGFEEGGRLPTPDDLTWAVIASHRFDRTCTSAGRFLRMGSEDARLEPGGPLAPGLDLGGAAKGLALDRAMETLQASGAVTAALISSMSSTVTFGTKPDGSVWRIGIEDPREPDRVLSVFSFEGDGALSTSGDYQRYFERNGVRYHHILDPVTGLPARGLRSLTVGGSALSGLDADILSTALFVGGRDEAVGYAEREGVAVYLVDDGGRTQLVPAPDRSGLVVTEEPAPLP